MIRYYNGVRVKVVRSFVLNSVHYTVVIRSGEEITVKTKELTESNEGSSLVQTAERIVSTVKDTVVEINSEGVTVSQKSAPDEEVEIRIPEVVLDVIRHNVVAVNNNGKETSLGLVEDLESSTQVKKMKLDIEAIQRCLDGKQKRHKGYSFKLEVE